MTPLIGSTTRAAALLLGVISLMPAQGLNPLTPSKEYIRLGGQVIAIENAVPAAAPVQPTVSPTSLTFASQTVGTTSSAQTVTLSNPGSATLTISSISSTSADFSESNTCGTSLAGGANCQINVTFTPQAAGARSGALSIIDNASGSPPSVTFSGTGASSGSPGSTPTVLTTYVGSWGTPSPTYTSEPSITVPFRVYVPSGISTFTVLQIVMNASGGGGYFIYLSPNGSTYNLYMSGQANGSGSAPYPAFQLTPNGQTVATNFSVGSLQVSNASLALSGNEMQLNLTLTQTGAATGYTILMAAQANGGYSVPWTGTTAATWAPSSAPPIAWSTSNFTYAGTDVGSVSASQTFTLSNSGSTAVSISSISMTGTNPDDFSIRSNECPASLAAGASCAVIVDFEPAISGNRSATLQAVNSAVGSPETVSLSGVGDGSELPPSVLTTYVGVWGDPTPAYNGSTVLLPFRVYCPSGISTLTVLQIPLTASGGGGFLIYLTPNGSTYNLFMSGQANGSGVVPSPAFQLTPNGQTVATNFSEGGLTVVSASLGFVGNELQLDLTLAQSGAFSYQIVMDATASGGIYSKPWTSVTAATWGN